MSAEPLFPRADKAAREVDPMLLAQALDHIAKSAAKSRSRTRRLRWIEQRAVIALAGREYRDIDIDLPKESSAGSDEKKARRIAKLLSSLHRLKACEGVTSAMLAIIDDALAPAPTPKEPTP